MVAALRAAADVGLLVVADGRLRFRHALTRDAVLATLLPPERAALAARAAACSTGAATARCAARLYRESGDPARGARDPRRAGPRGRAARGAVRSAAAFLDAGGRARRARRARARAHPARPRGGGPRAGEPALDRPARRAHARSCACGSPAPRSSPDGGPTPVGYVETRRAARRPPLAGAARRRRVRRGRRRAGRAASPAPPPRAVRDPALLCEALMVLGRSTFTRRPRGVRRGAAARRAGRRRARPAALAGAGAVRAGQPRAHRTATRPRRPSPPRASWRWRRACSPSSCRRTCCGPTAMLLVDGPVPPPSPLLRGAAEQAGRLRLTGPAGDGRARSPRSTPGSRATSRP